MYTNNSTFAACNESDEEEIVNGIKGALTRQKWKFQCQISNVDQLTDLSQTFEKLEKLAEAVVKAKYGPLQCQVGYEGSRVQSLLELAMIRAKNGIYRRLTTRMSTVHPWMVCCDIHMPREVFDLF